MPADGALKPLQRKDMEMMRENRIKKKLQSGQIALVLGGGFQSGDAIDFVGPLGFDGFWLEGEHGAISWHQIGDMTRACDLWGMSSIMRVHANEPGVITRVFDLGVSGIVVPHVNTKADAEQVAQSSKFAPAGRRGMFSGRRSYGRSDYFDTANDETIVIVLIEEKQAVDNLAELLTVDDIDVFFVAPSDLAQTMGYPGQLEHPAVQAVIDDALQQIVKAGKGAGALPTNDDLLKRYIDFGVQLFLTKYDAWIKAGAETYLSNVARMSG